MNPESGIFLTIVSADECQDIVAELLSRDIGVTALTSEPIDLPGCRTIVGNLAKVDHFVNNIALAAGILHLADSRKTKENVVLLDDILHTALLLDAWRVGPFIYLSSIGLQPALQNIGDTAPSSLKAFYPPAQIVNEFQLRLAPTPSPRTAAITLRRGLLLSGYGRWNFLRFIHRHCRLARTFVFGSEVGLEDYGMSFIGGGDLGRAVADALQIKASGIYNIASGFCTWRSVIETINRIAGTKAALVVRQSGQPKGNEIRLPQSRTFLDTSAFATQTGFVPRQSLEELVEEFARAERAAHPV